jgi:hypothetical protein
MKSNLARLCLLILVSPLVLGLAGCKGCKIVLTNVVTQHNNNSRTGAYLIENLLNPTNVQSSFGLLYSRAVDGAVYAQPLFIHGVPTKSSGTKNLFFIATETNMVYAFDAEDLSAGASPVFSRQLQPTGASSVCGETPSGVVGITGTPVIDPDANVMYVVARNANDQRHYLHKLDITNGFNDLAPPVAIGGTDPSGVPFNGQCQRQRPGLLLNNGIVYAAFGTFSCDGGCPDGTPYHGWVLGYKASDLSPAAIFCTSCANSGAGAGIWQTGGGLVSDGANIYFETGNGGPPIGDSFVKLQITSSWPGLSLAGSYTPVNAATLNNGDTDLGSGGPALIAGGFLVGGGKQGRYYVINTTNMQLAQDPATSGGFDGFQAFTNTYHNNSSQPACPGAGGATGCDAQPGTTCYVNPKLYGNGEICGPNIHSTPVFWQLAGNSFGYIYQMAEKDYVKAFHYDNATQHVQETAAVVGPEKPPDGMPGGFSSLSAAFGTNGILWTSFPLGDAQWTYEPGRISAFDALSLKEIWHDDGGYIFAKSVPPTIAEGKVFRATGSGTVLVYGLLTQNGQGKIIQHPPFATGADAIREIFKRSGAEHGLLGTAQGDPKPLEGGGWTQDFKSNLPLRGYTVASVHPNPLALAMSCSRPLPPGSGTQVESSVYWSPQNGAHIVTGEIRQFWLKQGGPHGPLGYPISDEVPSPDGSGRLSQFEHGEVIWHYDTGALISRR